MHVLILGGTGFVGRYMATALMRQGLTVSVVSRRAGKDGNGPRRVVWNGWDGAALAGLLDDIDAIINLQGENIGGGRWTPERKQAIVNSRVETGQALCVALRLRKDNPSKRLQPSCRLRPADTTVCGKTARLPAMKVRPPARDFWPKPAASGNRAPCPLKRWASAVACCALPRCWAKRRMEPPADFWSACCPPSACL
jgi:Predicted nucleoside-diphosphate sugar epimerase